MTIKQWFRLVSSTVAFLATLALVIRFAVADSSTKMLYSWTCDGCSKAVNQYVPTLPDGWIELAGGYGVKPEMWRDCSNDWKINDNLSCAVNHNGSPCPDEVPSECKPTNMVVIEHIHFCPACRKSPKIQRELGRRLMDQGYWAKDVRPKPMENLTIPSDKGTLYFDDATNTLEWEITTPDKEAK
jgi:hypothetical protein